MLLELQSPRIPLLTRSQCAQRRFHSYEQTLRQHIPSRGQTLTTMLLLLLLCTENPLTRSRHTTWGNRQNWHRRDPPCQAPVTSPQFLIIIFSKTTCHQGHHHPSPPIDQAARDEREFLTGLLSKVENQEEEEDPQGWILFVSSSLPSLLECGIVTFLMAPTRGQTCICFTLEFKSVSWGQWCREKLVECFSRLWSIRAGV
jgi:hypothetical protein